MLKPEAAWLAKQLDALPTDRLHPMLSLGSGAGQFRDDKQPWIGDAIYRPLDRRGVRVHHHEFVAAEGVDLAGDLDDPAFLETLQDLGARSVMCCNVLEHLANRELLIDRLPKLVGPGGYVIVTVPYRFPYHPDPIDTLYRPSVQDLQREFDGLELVVGHEVPCGTLLRYLRDAPDARESLVQGLRTSLSRLTKRSKPTGPARPSNGSGATAFLVRQTMISCAVFVRSGSTAG